MTIIAQYFHVYFRKIAYSVARERSTSESYKIWETLRNFSHTTQQRSNCVKYEHHEKYVKFPHQRLHRARLSHQNEQTERLFCKSWNALDIASPLVILLRFAPPDDRAGVAGLNVFLMAADKGVSLRERERSLLWSMISPICALVFAKYDYQWTY